MEVKTTCGATVLIDNEDEPIFRARAWRVYSFNGKFYAVASTGKGARYLHREILGAKAGEDVDHINGDTLDCRRQNLRRASRKENIRNQGLHKNNTSGFKGVKPVPSGRWVAKIMVDRRCLHLGTFDTREEAAHAYDTAAYLHFGAFARTNHDLGLI